MVGLTKGFLRGKALSVEGHSHIISELPGVVGIANGGTGVTNLNDLRKIFGYPPNLINTISVENERMPNLSYEIDLGNAGKYYTMYVKIVRFAGFSESSTEQISYPVQVARNGTATLITSTPSGAGYGVSIRATVTENDILRIYPSKYSVYDAYISLSCEVYGYINN